MTSNDELEPCPFCGNNIIGFNENKTVYGNKWFFADCPACGCRGPLGPSKAEGIRCWNHAKRSKQEG